VPEQQWTVSAGGLSISLFDLTIAVHIKGVHRNRIFLLLIVSKGTILQSDLRLGMTIINLAILFLHSPENLVMITHLPSEGLRHPETIGIILYLVVILMITDVVHLPMAKTETDILRPITKIVMLLRPNLFTAVMADPLYPLPLPMIGLTDEMVIVMETILRLHRGPGLHFVGETTTTGRLRGKLPVVQSIMETNTGYREYADYRGRPPSPHRYSDFNRHTEPPARFR
jgi:hypothetical protein